MSQIFELSAALTLDPEGFIQSLRSAEASARVKTALDNRYQAKLNETATYLPAENAIIKTCSVTVNDNYVAMIVAPNAADLVKLYNESFK